MMVRQMAKNAFADCVAHNTEKPMRGHRFHIVHNSGDAELGNWLVAGFAWAEERDAVLALLHSHPTKQEGAAK